MTPEVAVVVPTRRRETRLAFLLEALEEQTLAAERFEVVVVRDGRWDGPRAVAPERLPGVRFLSLPTAGGPAVARNVGWRAARAPLVAFTDDDCRPAPGWLEAVLAARGDERTAVQGRTEPDPAERHLLGGLARSQLVDAPSPWHETCNMAYPRALLEELGGFDESFPLGAGEDTDLGLRAIAAGARSTYAADALVWHAVHPRHLLAAVRDSLRWEAVPRVLSRHPAQRRHVYRRLFWKESHAKLLLAAVAGLGARRRRAALLGLLPYLELHLRQYDRTPRGAARAALDLPSQVTVDGVEVAVTVRSAVRHRVVLL